ncbi:hypothetical protein PF006_g31847 [Phytophthora fragariae]|uniref:Uncharacterized protein n=1 Tax=Phytophthora fragariae TaxID=53985 RepID=A0A6A3PNH5_9STRA|nr:hypothetical protein PF006_g31847 [Phytophthora fragariae]
MPVRWLIDLLTASRSNGGRATWIDDTEGASEGLIDARTASRSNGGRATWIDVTEGALEGASDGAHGMGAHAAGLAEVTGSVLEGGSLTWGRAAWALHRADGSPPSESWERSQSWRLQLSTASEIQQGASQLGLGRGHPSRDRSLRLSVKMGPECRTTKTTWSLTGSASHEDAGCRGDCDMCTAPRPPFGQATCRGQLW